MILVGTAKGLIHYEIDHNLKVLRHEANHFVGFSVSTVYTDPRSGRWWLGLNHKHWGQKLHFSDDKGQTWEEVKKMPVLTGHTLPSGSKAAVRQIWSVQHGGSDRPETLWMGIEPGALFKSEDSGSSWHLVESLWYHESRKKEGQWFGTGSDHPFIHSIVVDPRDSDHLYVAVSCAGIFESRDGGSTWIPRNQGLKATYLPTMDVDVGHDPHRLLMSTTHPEILWQQNHCGIFLSKDGGGSWRDVSEANGVPSYGFALAIDDEDPARAWVIPAESDAQRTAPDLKLRVYHTDNFGESWISVSDGLPQENVYDIVLRHAFVKRNDLLVFGTTNGNLFSADVESMKWQMASHHLAKVNCITIV